MENTIYSLIPPVLALIMVIATRRVLLSLGVGILVGAFMLKDFQVGPSLSFIYEQVKGIFVDGEGLNTWELYILFFLLILGVMAAFIHLSGGTHAFGEWAMKRVKTRVGAQLFALLLGIIIFIDDYFNSLTVGNVSRPLTDRYKISRAKLAYIVDSTAAPICIIAPLSSWGAYIITLIVGVLATHGMTQYEGLQAFVYMIPMNFYSILALLMVLAVILLKLDIGPMRKHEQRALSTGELVDPQKGMLPGDQSIEGSRKGSVGHLVWPIFALIAGTIYFMVHTGIANTENQVTLLAIFENTDVAAALLYGGLIGLTVSFIGLLLQRVGAKDLGKGSLAGIKSMLPAMAILIFAWVISGVIDGLGTGSYLAGLVNEHIEMAYLPAIIFILAGLMAFATGSSWGTFALLLPIAGEISATLDGTMMLPTLAAVLAGAVFGDHCSPISDTTILSSTGAGSHHIDHVITQLPYALILAAISTLGYLVLGYSGSVIVALGATLVLFTAAIMVMKRIAQTV